MEVVLGEPLPPPDLRKPTTLPPAASDELRLENKILKLMATINALWAGVNALSSDESALAEAKTKLEEETANLMAL
ncbi:hypothetical protein SDRG_16483 [Saprolegnia diclina VS20]|uniref:Uncharacterized protein n=1 Tax=Saprolegnia diclina (strain VS20) TaxID=1156394 RepID=T0R841_SAPDV|nr:hypothetical protein SDRG_16483 [Saprolegnia diclina VS20]EQC25662.1 hypothetical protein SDRG_16483 [Saprolegnia diclina VS20]|eukprot:XP_008620919.1 hypothetical protein SDRG_16483 [Saprolegnia diclina VS20]